MRPWSRRRPSARPTALRTSTWTLKEPPPTSPVPQRENPRWPPSPEPRGRRGRATDAATYAGNQTPRTQWTPVLPSPPSLPPPTSTRPLPPLWPQLATFATAQSRPLLALALPRACTCPSLPTATAWTAPPQSNRRGHSKRGHSSPAEAPSTRKRANRN